MSAIIIHNVDQNSDEWHKLRAGIPTASCFSDILAQGEGKTRAKYMRKLAGEIITGQPEEGYRNSAMDRGHAMEDQARNSYALLTDSTPERVGFVTHEIYRAGCSPDSLIGANGGLEIKTAIPSVLIELLEKDAFPSAHVAQVQGSLWITEREWWDIVVFWPGMPMLVKRAYRDVGFLAKLAREVARFREELEQMVERIKARGQ